MRLRKAKQDIEILNILSDPELFYRVSEDGALYDGCYFDFENDHYLIIEVDGTDIGYWLLHRDNGSSTTLMIHAHILKEYREHAVEAGTAIIWWFVNEADEEYKKLVAEIPTTYPDVYHYTKKFGFQDEGINRKSIMKNGKLVDQYRLGLTREEAMSWEASKEIS